MQLLPEEKLLWSPVVANSRMNRERKAIGTNSYEKEFGFSPQAYLQDKLRLCGHTSWLDLCCGQGNALMETAQYFLERGNASNIVFQGIDLVDTIIRREHLTGIIDFQFLSIVNWTPSQHFDLITCCHGLHYIGDKLQVISTAINSLTAEGLFIAQLDLKNINIQGKDSLPFLKRKFNKYSVAFQSRNNLLRREGNAEIDFGLHFLGADDNSGPNYTGQEAVTSYYAIR